MHSYSTTQEERRLVPLLLALAAVAATHVVHLVLAKLEASPPLWAYAPSAFGIYGVLFVLFDKFLWKLRLLWRVGLIKTPCLAGRWSGELRTSRSGTTKVYPVSMEVHQTWSATRVTVEGERSKSLSDMLCFVANSPTDYEMRWEYRAESKDPASITQFNHRGVTRLRVAVGESGLVRQDVSGDYYTQHERDTAGTLVLKRVKK